MSTLEPAASVAAAQPAEPGMPALRLARQIDAPVQQPASASGRSVHAWQTFGVTPQEIVRDRIELERLDRAMVELRRQVHAARAQAVAARVDLARAQSERLPATTVWGLGAVAAVGLLAWAVERRRRRSAEADAQLDLGYRLPGWCCPRLRRHPAGEAADDSAMQVTPDEAELWIQRAQLALPPSR